MIEQFHFLRPWWLLALIPLAALVWHILKYKNTSGNWQSVVDPELLRHLLVGWSQGRHNWPAALIALVGLFGVIALAGPVWEKLPQPIFKQQAALVIALDLSRSMDANDIKPSRLTRARHKIADILLQRVEGQSALVAYAADAFVVTPLTEDSATINALLPSLSTDIMPAQGGRADRAVKKSLELFSNAGVTHGDILIVSDGVSTTEVVETERLIRESPDFRISILGIGSETGGPIPLATGGFLKDSQGSIIISRIPVDGMRALARQGSGIYRTISIGDSDIQDLLHYMQSNRLTSGAVASSQHANIWREQGPWLILLSLPLIALAFRRGVLLILPLLILPFATEVDASGWDEIWRNSDQRGALLFDRGDHDAAAEVFDSPTWKASSLYRAGKYEEAAQFWNLESSVDSQYNRGNALAKMGRYEEAIKAYQQVLNQNSQHLDATYNKQLLEDLLQQQQKQQQNNQQNKDPQDSGESNQDQNPGEGKREAQPGSGESQGQQQSEKNSSAQEDQSERQQSTETESAQTRQARSKAERNAQTESEPEAETETETETESEAEVDRQMSEQAARQWLRKIPDDPGGLLRRKFIYQYKNRGSTAAELNQW